MLQTGRRIWKISGFGDAVKHVHATKLFTVPPGSKRAVGQPVLLTWSADNVLRLWDQVVRFTSILLSHNNLKDSLACVALAADGGAIMVAP